MTNTPLTSAVILGRILLQNNEVLYLNFQLVTNFLKNEMYVLINVLRKEFDIGKDNWNSNCIRLLGVQLRLCTLSKYWIGMYICRFRLYVKTKWCKAYVELYLCCKNYFIKHGNVYSPISCIVSIPIRIRPLLAMYLKKQSIFILIYSFL